MKRRREVGSIAEIKWGCVRNERCARDIRSMRFGIVVLNGRVMIACLLFFNVRSWVLEVGFNCI